MMEHKEFVELHVLHVIFAKQAARVSHGPHHYSTLQVADFVTSNFQIRYEWYDMMQRKESEHFFKSNPTY